MGARHRRRSGSLARKAFPLAVVTGPLHSSEARGRVGGLVYNVHRGRAYVKANTAPVTQFSDAQIEARAKMWPVLVMWNYISDDQRRLWADFAAEHPVPSWTGSDVRLSGHNWFCKINYRLQMIEETLRSIPPTSLTSVVIPVTVDGVDPAFVSLSWSHPHPDPEPYWTLHFWLAGPHSPGRNPTIKLAKYKQWTYLTDPSTEVPLPGVGTYSLFTVPISGQGISSPYDLQRFTVT